MGKREKKIRIFSALEIANICGVVNQTAINWIKNGFLEAFVTPGGQYRVYAEDLYEFLTSRGMRIPEELKVRIGIAGMWKKILIIEDDKNLNNMLKKRFSSSLTDHTIQQAFDGFEAGRIITDWNPGVIILDINLPGVDGHELCKRIKGDVDLGNPIVIAISGLPDLEVKESILAEGADAFWAKPFDINAVSKDIEERVKERSA